MSTYSHLDGEGNPVKVVIDQGTAGLLHAIDSTLYDLWKQKYVDITIGINKDLFETIVREFGFKYNKKDRPFTLSKIGKGILNTIAGPVEVFIEPTVPMISPEGYHKGETITILNFYYGQKLVAILRSPLPYIRPAW